MNPLCDFQNLERNMLSSAWISRTKLKWNTSNASLFYDKRRNIIVAILSSKTKHRMVEYSFETDKWRKCHKINETLKQIPNTFYTYPNESGAVINFESNIVYINNRAGSIVILKIKQNTLEVIDGLVRTGIESKEILIRNELHIIGGMHSNKHFRFDHKTKKLDIVHSFDNLSAAEIATGIAQISGKLLTFVGDDDAGAPYDQPEVLEYNISNNEWRTLQTKSGIPREMYKFGCVSVLNNQYVLLFGGGQMYLEIERYRDIYIYSISKQTFTKSTIKCPKRDTYCAVNVSNHDRDQSIVFGFVRRQWKDSQIAQQLFPPEYLLRLMHSFYLNEFVHVFQKGGKHWRINVFDIISSC